MNKLFIFLLMLFGQIAFGQKTYVRFLLVKNENFIVLKKDFKNELKRSLKGKWTVRNDSVFCKPRVPFDKVVDSVTYTAISKDSIYFRLSHGGLGRTYCEHDTILAERNKCFAWYDTLDSWSSRYPGYSIKDQLYGAIHSNYMCYIVVYKFKIRAFYKDIEFFNFQMTGNHIGNIFVNKCLKYDPNFIRIELSNIYMGLGGQVLNKFYYPQTVNLDLKSVR